jgi:soluble cytochrome b562
MEQVAENLNIEHPEAHNAATHAKTFRNEYKAFDRIGIYTQRLVNNANKILKQLKDIQAERRSREKQEMDEAARLYQFHRMQELAFEPAQNGFDFSVDQIKQHIRRENLRKQSAAAAELDFNRIAYRKKYGTIAA